VTGFSLDETDMAKLNTSSGLRFAKVQIADGATVGLVCKVTVGSAMSQQMGLAREAHFYRQWSSLQTADGSTCELNMVLPRVFHAEGDMTTGDKVVVMHDMSSTHVQLGYFYGPGNPNNWGKDLETLTSKLPRRLDVADATRMAFQCAAKLHAPFWGCRALTELSWYARWIITTSSFFRVVFSFALHSTRSFRRSNQFFLFFPPLLLVRSSQVAQCPVAPRGRRSVVEEAAGYHSTALGHGQS
jgi:hypothetical protein